MRLARPAAALVPLALAACQSQWYQDSALREIVRTDLVVETEPDGATVWLNGVRMDAAPVRIPVEYEHILETWSRQTNQGARIREATGWIGTILLLPVWLPASLFHGTEEMKRHQYAGNRHAVTARRDGAEASRQVDLAGEAEVRVRIALPSGDGR